MHPLHRPIVLIIWLCVVIIGLNAFAFWWLQARIPAVASKQVDRTAIRLVEPSAQRAPCEPTVAGDKTLSAEHDVAVAQLQAEVDRLKSMKGENGAVWRTKAEQVEQDLTVLQKAAERVLVMDPRHWQEGKLLLAHALVKEKP